MLSIHIAQATTIAPRKKHSKYKLMNEGIKEIYAYNSVLDSL